jgi:outer membrane protein OmpA-like peptidoglycan-associated protein
VRSAQLHSIETESIAMIVHLQIMAHRGATLFLGAVPWILLSTCVPTLVGCGTGKSGTKQTTAPESLAGANRQAAGTQSHSESEAATPRSQSEYEDWYDSSPAPWHEDANLDGANQVPLKEGLMVTTAITSDLGDYESIKTVVSNSSYGVQVYASANVPHQPSPWYKDDPPFRRVHTVVAIPTNALQHGTGYVKDFTPGQDAELPGSTAISFSSDLLASLKSGKETQVGWGCGVSEVQCADGPLKRIESHPVPFPVLLKGRRINLPAVHARCKMHWTDTMQTGTKDEHGQYVITKVPPYTPCDFWILDNPDNPLVLAWEMRADAPKLAWLASRGVKANPSEDLQAIEVDYLPPGFLRASLTPEGGPPAGPLGPLSGPLDIECARRAGSAVEYVQRCLKSGNSGGPSRSNDQQGASGGGSGGSGGGPGGAGSAGSSSGTGSGKGLSAQGANAGQAGSSGAGGAGDQSAKQIEQQLAEKKPVQIYGIYFDFASAIIRPESELVLSEIADILERNPDWTLNVDGHTDNIGGVAFNQQLSEQRAAAVKDALVTRYHIAPNRLLTRGYGLTHPVESNDTLAGRARNRRVELMRQ